MKSLISIDPGMSTGIVLAGFEPDEPMQLDHAYQVSGGIQGALLEIEDLIDAEMVIVCEKFSPRPGARSWKLAELEPLRIEGALEAIYGDRIYWRKPEQRKLVRDLPTTEHFLKANGYWTSPKDVGRKDADDANAATMHALGYLRDRAHRPTIDMLIHYGDTMTEELV